MNQVNLFGHVGKDPEVRNTTGGTVVANFSLATSERYTKNGEKHETTEWHNIVAFAGLADIVSMYVRKGNRLLVSGKIKTRSWDKDGEKRYRTEVVALNIKLIDKNDDDVNQDAPARDPVHNRQTNAPAHVDMDPDLPF